MAATGDTKGNNHPESTAIAAIDLSTSTQHALDNINNNSKNLSSVQEIACLNYSSPTNKQSQQRLISALENNTISANDNMIRTISEYLQSGNNYHTNDINSNYATMAIASGGSNSLLTSSSTPVIANAIPVSTA